MKRHNALPKKIITITSDSIEINIWWVVVFIISTIIIPMGLYILFTSMDIIVIMI